jgi:hypothetical protein
VVVVGCFLAAPSVRAAAPEAAPPEPPAGADVPPVVHPDLGTVRYRDPTLRRTLWAGFDLSGAYVPKKLGLLDRTVWMVQVVPAWALALTPWLAVGGRHGLTWYDAQNIRLRVHTHQLELSGAPLRWHPRLRDRLAAGFEVHDVKQATVDGIDFRLGGFRDVVGLVGYGIEHRLAPRWRLGWQVQLRHAWVLLDTQRQVRGSARATFLPRPPHALGLEVVGFYVNRNPDQAGTTLPPNTVHGQIALDYAWMSRAGVGLVVRGRLLSSFMSGEAPVYEIREESLEAAYGELVVGLRVVWD